MGRSKLRIAVNILWFLVGIFLIVVGVYATYSIVYFPHEAPTGPSKPVTTTESLIHGCILISLVVTVLEGISETAQAMKQLVSGGKAK